jgi:hypothetical protein
LALDRKSYKGGQMSRTESMESGLSTAVETRVQDEHRRRFEELVARALGDHEEELRELTALDPLTIARPSPWPGPGSSPPDSPLSRTIAAKEISVRRTVQREIEAEAEARLPRPGFAPHSHQLRYPPYDPANTPNGLVDGETTHGGHAANEQFAYGDPKEGLLGIWTKIDDDSSQTDSTGFFDVTVRPILSRGNLVVTPF